MSFRRFVRLQLQVQNQDSVIFKCEAVVRFFLAEMVEAETVFDPAAIGKKSGVMTRSLLRLIFMLFPPSLAKPA